MFAYYHLQTIDRKRNYSKRMQRIEAAQLFMIAMHEPDRLEDERLIALHSASKPGTASPSTDAELLAYGRRLANAVAEGKVLS